VVAGRPAVVFGGHEIPPAWHVGEFELELAELTDGRLDEAAGVLRGVAGKGKGFLINTAGVKKVAQ